MLIDWVCTWSLEIFIDLVWFLLYEEEKKYYRKKESSSGSLEYLYPRKRPQSISSEDSSLQSQNVLSTSQIVYMVRLRPGVAAGRDGGLIIDSITWRETSFCSQKASLLRIIEIDIDRAWIVCNALNRIVLNSTKSHLQNHISIHSFLDSCEGKLKRRIISDCESNSGPILVRRSFSISLPP